MASPRRARSLFLSPDKAELLAAQEINSLVNRVEVIPRKSVPRQGRRTDTGVKTTYGDENRISTTSTISTVDAFCREYRPPSVALHRLSYLNKKLPPPPPSETPKQTLFPQDIAKSRASTQKDAAVQTTISIQSRYSTRIKPARSRLSTISSQQRESEDRVSIRSHISTQDYSIDRDPLRSERRSNAVIDRRRPSVVGNPIKDKARRQSAGSINPSVVPYQNDICPVANCEVQDPRRQGAETETGPWSSQETQGPLTSTESKEIVLKSIPRRQGQETDSRASQEIQDPLASTESKEITPRSIPKPRISVGWTFSDGFLLRTQDDGKSTTGSEMLLREKNLALEHVSLTPMTQIRWTFNDGIMYKSINVPGSDDDMYAAKSKRSLLIGWSFHDGLTIRHDGSVTKISEATTSESEDKVHDGSKSKRMVPLIGWSFQEGFTVRCEDAVKVISTATGESEEVVDDGGKSKSIIPIAWSFHDGLTIRPADDSSGEVIHDESKSERIIPIAWSFHDGLTIRPADDSSGEVVHDRSSSKHIIPIGWSFHDGLKIRPTDEHLVKVMPSATTNEGQEIL